MANRNQTFVDDSQVASVLGVWSKQQWTEQSFLGEDFAGRQEYDDEPKDVANVREISQDGFELGSSYSRAMPKQNEIAQPPCRPLLNSWQPINIQPSPQWRRRAITAASSAAALISAALFGILYPKKPADVSPKQTDESLTPYLATGHASANFENWQPETATNQENFQELTSTKRR